MEKCIWEILVHFNNIKNSPIPTIKKIMLVINRFFIIFNWAIVFGFPNPPNETAIERPIPIPAGIPKVKLLKITCPYTSPKIIPMISHNVIGLVNLTFSGADDPLSSFMGTLIRDSII